MTRCLAANLGNLGPNFVDVGALKVLEATVIVLKKPPRLHAPGTFHCSMLH